MADKFSWHRLAALVLGIFVLSTSTAQAFRLLPDNIRLGELQGIEQNRITISGKTYRIAPGSRIRDRNNRIVVPGSAPATGSIAFNVDYLGQVLGVWILTPQEAETLSRRLSPPD
ncbi:MAG: hypothetical protein GC151_06405 [Betaproteobacteria bacterium]|nr:hypothetical protein [Betaproteobacteria bacterium]